jgi:hypothetical protein
MTARLAGPCFAALAFCVPCAACGGGDPTVTPAPELVVGVIPYGLEPMFCPQGPDHESVYLKMDDEDDSACSAESGDLGEGRWVLPHANKYWFPTGCSTTRDHTLLRFCRARVREDAFKPLTSDPLDTAQFYAILKFGERCPEHSVEVSKLIVNEDVGTDNAPTDPSASELLYPNEIVDGGFGNYTRLFFCYFRSAPSAAETMKEFPELGLEYGVFHDFEGAQPGWVIRKRWQFSDDSNEDQPVNRYFPDPELDESVAGFSNLVENPLLSGSRNTCFDIARVR